MKTSLPATNMQLNRNATIVQNALTAAGIEVHIRELSDSTRTSHDAAQAVSCKLGQIAKSLIFKGKGTDQAYLVIASGPNRVDETLVSEAFGVPIEMASAKFVQKSTGFEVGGVPPVGHKEKLPTFIDEDLMKFEAIWAAAGTSHAVFRLTPEKLVRITGGRVGKVTHTSQ